MLLGLIIGFAAGAITMLFFYRIGANKKKVDPIADKIDDIHDKVKDLAEKVIDKS